MLHIEKVALLLGSLLVAWALALQHFNDEPARIWVLLVRSAHV